MSPETLAPPYTGPPSSLEEQVLSIAAMFQEHFNIDWLVELTGLKATQLLVTLENLVKSKHLVSVGPGTYSFSDRDMQNALVQGVSEKPKQELHKRIAAMLMDEFAENPNSPHLLSHHLLQIPNNLESCQCLIKAGDIHLAEYHNETAFQCYSKVINDLSTLTGEDVDRLFSETAIKYSKLSTARHDTSHVLNILYDALERAEAMDSVPIQVLLRMHVAKNEWLKARYTKSLTSFEKGWRQAEALNDPKLLRTANTF